MSFSNDKISWVAPLALSNRDSVTSGENVGFLCHSLFFQLWHKLWQVKVAQTVICVRTVTMSRMGDIIGNIIIKHHPCPGYVETYDYSLGEHGMFMNTKYDTWKNLNEYFPGRAEAHFGIYSPLLSALLLSK